MANRTVCWSIASTYRFWPSVFGQGLAFLDQLQQFREDALGQRVVARGASDGDLVAAHVHVAHNRTFDESQQLVAGPQQLHHGVRVVDRDPGLDLLAALVGGGGWGLAHSPAARALRHLLSISRSRAKSPSYRHNSAKAGRISAWCFRATQRRVRRTVAG